MNIIWLKSFSSVGCSNRKYRLFFIDVMARAFCATLYLKFNVNVCVLYTDIAEFVWTMKILLPQYRPVIGYFEMICLLSRYE